MLFTGSAYAAEDDFLDAEKKAAEQGDADAQAMLGLMYSIGVESVGVPEDDAEAVRWYRQAAEQGDADAQAVLGFMYANGEGVPEDDAEAARWYRQAAEQGHANAQARIGAMYAMGEGVPENDIQAYAWISIAAAQSVEYAKKAKEILTGEMTRAEIAEAQKLSRKYWEAFGPNHNSQ